MLSGHVIVCGLDSLGIRLVEDVIVIADEVPSDRLASASRAGASVIRGHCRDEESMLIVTGATMLALFYALLIDATVGVRLARAPGGVRGQIRDHVVVCGLGNSVTWSASSSRTMSAGDSLAVVATRKWLAQVLKRARSRTSIASRRVVTP